MSHISIHRLHRMTQKNAKQAAVQVARELETEFELSCRWAGNTLSFERPGLSGTLVVSKQAIDIEIELVGLVLGMLRTRIEAGVEEQLDRLFGAQ